MKVGIYNWANAGVHQTTDVLERIRLRRPLTGVAVYRNGILNTWWHSAVWDWCRRHFVEVRPCDKADLRRIDLAGVVTFGAPAWYVESLQRYGRIVWALPAVPDPPVDYDRKPTGVYLGACQLVELAIGHLVMLDGAVVGDLREDGARTIVRVRRANGSLDEARVGNVYEALEWVSDQVESSRLNEATR